MGCNVYANDDEIACKAGGGKVIAAFPDVCLSPPTPPAGPIPIPYPDTSFSKDMKKGSKKVKIKNKEIMLKDKSFYKSSPLGDEAATKTLGAGVITHVITGKTYFVAWSMDVRFEGKNVDRHTDLTTSNHASPMANGQPPWTNISEQSMKDIKKDKCPCCGEPLHSQGKPMNGKDWYAHRAEVEGPRTPRPPTKKKPARTEITVATKQQWAVDQIEIAENRAGCSCPPGTKVLPEDPCNVFFSLPPKPEPVTKSNQKDRANAQKAQTQAARQAFNPKAPAVGIKQKINAKRVADGKEPCKKFNHLVPIAAGGCPGTDDGGNLQCNDVLCPACKTIDADFKKEGKDLQTIQFPETSAKL